MHDIASQLVLKWARRGPDARIPVTDDFTRLTLDTIALCAMDYRFNSFYQDDMHPFVQAMVNTLSAGASRAKTPSIIQKLQWVKNERTRADMKLQSDVAAEMVKQRRENPSDKRDLLNAMINGRDPKTGEPMRDGLIAANMIAFLVAGHETTSGLLSFAFYNLLKNPATYFEAQQEVDRVVGHGKITVDHLKDLGYINAVLRETLRLTPTAPAFVRGVRPENNESPPTLAGGKYELERDWTFLCLIGKIQRDPKVYGEDANEFRPSRMADGEFEKLPKAAWKPFGTGMRACIGRPFAWQEALLVMALLLQNFDFRMDDPSYELKIKSNLTIKPEGFNMRASLRKGISVMSLQHTLSGAPTDDNGAIPTPPDSDKAQPDGGRITILYGSNTGTCQSLAQKLAAEAGARGYQASLNDMDSGINALPTDQPVAIITASYEGFPTDNAAQFVAWLQSMSGASSLQGVTFGVFGCGHKDWASTFQRIPKLVDATLEKLGGERLVQFGSSDVSRGDMFSDFDTWTEQSFWPAVSSRFSTEGIIPSTTESASIQMEISTKTRASQLQHDVQQGKVLATKVLTVPGEPEKRHIEIKLPEGTEYAAGDYLAILPLNPDESVRRVLSHFSLPADAVVTIKGGGPVTLPVNQPISASGLLKGFVELSLPATKKNIQACAEHTSDTATLEILDGFVNSIYQAEIIANRVSVLDLLELHPKIALPFPEFLAMLPPMRPRHYSISSSPLKDPTTCSLTYGVINTNALAGTGRFQGVSGNYLRSLQPGDAVQVSVRSAPAAFHLPASSHTTPILMFCNGTGLAPFRGFVQERAVLLASNPHQALAPALLFVGCRSPSADSLYHEEFAQWARAGAVDIRYAYSREPDHPSAAGCKYVQDRMLRDQEDVVRMWEQGAKVYLCGSPGMVEGARKISREIAEEKRSDAIPEQIETFFKRMRNERIAVDVFA
ncbi:cytochrome P450 [Amniculicola lignicola CBS 123094]|uniref:Cytochrome P450 n=1 Tax=Amniculicola lignicola CBS 123094 TaxID=1392246 RepID=A0A6A5VVF4_9PLEO|nr:cytochrome P450 [Amniculicola lignicola CBS 123094]